MGFWYFSWRRFGSAWAATWALYSDKNRGRAPVIAGTALAWLATLAALLSNLRVPVPVSQLAPADSTAIGRAPDVWVHVMTGAFSLLAPLSVFLVILGIQWIRAPWLRERELCAKHAEELRAVEAERDEAQESCKSGTCQRV